MFSPDSKLMQVLSRVADLFLLNILYILCCLPVFTIGAATTALYTMCFRLIREEYSGIVKSYFRAFRENFRQATVLWCILLLVAVPGCCYIRMLLALEGTGRYAAVPFVVLVLAALMAGSYGFPWLSQFDNTAVKTLKNALILSLSHLPRTAAVLAINAMPVIVLLIDAQIFAQISFLWIALYFSAAAYMNAGLLWHVFKPYRTSGENQ